MTDESGSESRSEPVPNKIRLIRVNGQERLPNDLTPLELRTLADTFATAYLNTQGITDEPDKVPWVERERFMANLPQGDEDIPIPLASLFLNLQYSPYLAMFHTDAGIWLNIHQPEVLRASEITHDTNRIRGMTPEEVYKLTHEEGFVIQVRGDNARDQLQAVANDLRDKGYPVMPVES